MLHMPSLYERAVQLLPTIGETHWLKASLAVGRFALRYPEWGSSILPRALEHAGWSTAPAVNSLLHTAVDPKGFAVAPRRAQALIARSLFPIAYTAANAWYQQEGLAPVILAYKERAIHEGTYLGHGWTVWCSFYEILPYLPSDEARQYALERFVEFAAKCFPGYPSSDPQWVPPQQADPGPVDPVALLDRVLERPGFLGHHLLTFGYLHRHRELLSEPEWRVGLHQVWTMTDTAYVDPEDNVLCPAADVPDTPVDDGDLEQAVRKLILEGPDNAHSLTVADIACEVWSVASGRQRRHLIHYLGSLIPVTP